ncbi:MAG: hypothetical protein JWL81_3525, partial [Verrucomicrobiales bacterium]|nr:hypothetical protein [Verrucomicrobiales bacterium]
DLTPPLPAVMALLPVLFYVAVIGSLALGAMSMIATKKAIAAEESALAREQDENSQLAAIQTELAGITDEQNRAKEVEGWVASTTPLMTMITSVINSVKTGNTLTSLRLSRTPENPEHVEMMLLINNGGSAQVEETRNALSKEGYQAFKEESKSAERSTRLGDVTYSAVFVNTGKGNGSDADASAPQ